MPKFRAVSPERIAALKDVQKEYLGSGCSRRVTAYGPYALKEGSEHYNRIEWKIWQQFKGTPEEKYLCPIIAISEDGRYLLMVKVDRTLNDEQEQWRDENGYYRGGPSIDAELSQFCYKNSIYDTHSGNIGILDGRQVLIDYAA